MQKDYSIFQIPSFAKAEAYDFDTSDKSLGIFEELNQISEEIERCRLKNCS
ncbi:MAG: hypothetical protein Q4B29_02325 [Candidatus Saccharibacteria bacterium]|nr:hypothetical protein [Candidatus Saccharibacteria bacterium]